METYTSKDEYYSVLCARAEFPLGFRAASVPLTFFPAERPADKPYRMNLSLISVDPPGCRAAGVFTRNSFPGAPVVLARKRLLSPSVAGILINNRVANVCAPGGEEAAEEILGELETLSGQGVFLPASTGIIGWRLPVREMKESLPALLSGLSDESVLPVAEGILTTDSFPKIRSAEVGGGRIVGIAKGAGMIEPNLATMLVFLLTDIPLTHEELDRSCREAAAESFNTITVDGDQSTSDMMLLLSSGKGRAVPYGDFSSALQGVCRDLCEDIVRNGEGTSHVIRVTVAGAPDRITASGAAKAVVNSPLVKTAIFGNDPNLGRIIGALGSYTGNRGIALDSRKVSVSFGEHRVFHDGSFHLERELEEVLSAYLRQAAMPEVNPGYPVHDRLVDIGIDLASGTASASALGSDLSYQYVRENADYRT